MEITSINICKKAKKATPSAKRIIEKASRRLCSRLDAYLSQDIPFHAIVDPTIKHDKYGDSFFCFRIRGEDNTQLRILYTCMVIDERAYVVIVDYVSKRKASDNSYLDDFNWVKSLDASSIVLSAI